jgi:hypothetical protein
MLKSKDKEKLCKMMGRKRRKDRKHNGELEKYHV